MAAIGGEGTVSGEGGVGCEDSARAEAGGGVEGGVGAGLGGDGHDGTVGGETAAAWSTRLANMSKAESREVQAGDDEDAGGGGGTIHASPAESIRVAKTAPASCAVCEDEGGGGIVAAAD